MIPKEIRRYFWDTDPAALHEDTHKTYIIERILDLGDTQAVRWLWRTYSKDDLREALAQSKRISPKSATFWNLILSSYERAAS